ncbi:MAG: SDR family oxidoreductase [Verrucomicrobia bacterium]|nr:SDR family oxidoreductase [Verrucomicrobiota bacterium]
MRFKDAVVVVTGASRGIGKGIAESFAREGAKAALVGRDEGLLAAVCAEISASGGEAFAIHADVSKQQEMEKMAQSVLSRYGKIDILCHNAGIYPCSRLESMSLGEWQKVIDINLTGTFLAVKACIPWMKQAKMGKIVITSSISGPTTAFPGFAHYAASKAGVNGFVRTCAVELAKYNINVNAVEPGTIINESVEALGEEHVSNMVRAVPLGRLGTCQDVAAAIMFLASPEASYITGQSIIIDGGQVLPESSFMEF